MRKDHVLITGGAGFIGSHLADELLERGYAVRILDNLSPQVHGPTDTPPEYLSDQVEFLYGDVRDPEMVRRALSGIDVVVHLAAAIGAGQSMYEIRKYMADNTLGTAVLLEALMANPVRHLVVASSMSIYGEGLYVSQDGRTVAQARRSAEQLKRGMWEVYEDFDAPPLIPVPTAEAKRPDLSSIYALSKYDQERMSLMIGRAYDIPTTALRFFNVFGTRQALSNPYTGVLAIFASRLLNEKPPLVYEDGLQKRDFVHVYDVANAIRLCLENPASADAVLNVGSGRAFSVGEIADEMRRVLNRPHIEPVISGRYRVGDIRHCFADISAARQVIGYEPKVVFSLELEELAGWVDRQRAENHVDMAAAQLSQRGLTV
jgi:dTDP-L-rhamnose 4-epimerase